jgi:peptide deformylase
MGRDLLAILTVGDPRLEAVCSGVEWPDADLEAECAAMHATLAEFRQVHGYGRAMAAPQVGIMKRVVVLQIGDCHLCLINPEIVRRSEESFELWDDCLSVPEVIVRVSRAIEIDLRFRDEMGREHTWLRLPRELSELMQHELDHLDGVLMTRRAVGRDAVRPIGERWRLMGEQRPEISQTERWIAMAENGRI